MKVSFEATLEDLVDVHLRILKRSKRFEAERRKVWVMGSIAVGLITFAVIPETIEIKLISGVIGALLTALLYPFSHQKSVEKRVRNYCRDQVGTDGSFVVEVELSEQGLTFKQLKTQVTHDWSTVQDIQVSDDRTDFLLQGGGLATVRARAFETPEQRETFLELANHYWKTKAS